MNIKETLFEKLSKTLFKQSYKTCLLYYICLVLSTDSPLYNKDPTALVFKFSGKKNTTVMFCIHCYNSSPR